MAAADKPHGLGVLWVSMLLVLLTSAFLVQGLIVGDEKFDEVQAAGFAAEVDGEWVADEESSATVTSLPTDSLHQHHNLGLDNATAAPAATAAGTNHHGAGQTTASSRLLEESASESEKGSQGAASGGSDAASGEPAGLGGEKRAVHHRRGHRRSSRSQDQSRNGGSGASQAAASGDDDYESGASPSGSGRHHHRHGGSHARSQGRRSSGRGSRSHRNQHRGHSPKRGSGGNGGNSWGEGTDWQVVPDADGPKVRPRSPDGKPENWQEVSSTHSQEEVIINRDHGHGTKPGNTFTEKGKENEEGEHHMYHDHYHEHEHEHDHNHFFHRDKLPKGTYAAAASQGSKTAGRNHKA